LKNIPLILTFLDYSFIIKKVEMKKLIEKEWSLEWLNIYLKVVITSSNFLKK